MAEELNTAFILKGDVYGSASCAGAADEDGRAQSEAESERGI